MFGPILELREGSAQLRGVPSVRHCSSFDLPPTRSAAFDSAGYFKAGSISVRSVAGSNRFGIVIGSTVTITSSVGDTYAARTWPARVVPSALPTPYAYGLRPSLDRARYHRSSQSLRADLRRESSYTF